MTNHELAEKVQYLRDSGAIFREVAMGLHDDHFRRVIARGVLVSLDSFLKLAPQLKNRLPHATKADKELKRDIEGQIDQLRRDYDKSHGGYYDAIRDGFGGHRLPLPLAEVVTLWADVDESVAVILTEAMERICSKMAPIGLNPALPATLLADAGSAASVIDAILPKAGVLRVNADDLGLTRANSVSLVPNEGRLRYTRIRSLVEFISFGWECATQAIASDVQERLIALWLLDAFSFLEGMYEETDSSGKTMHDDLVARQSPSAAIVKAGSDERDPILEVKPKNVRNHLAAHLDQSMTLTEIRAELGSSDLPGFAHYVGKHVSVFQNVCRSEATLLPLLIHGKTLAGFGEVEHRPRGFSQ